MGGKNHGMHKTSTYSSWQNMIQRCTNLKNTHYPEYGGRGITICDRWLDFKNFFVDMSEKPEGLTLERIDNSKSYSPDNCRWATRKEQASNRRSSLYTLKGVTKSWAEWFKDYGIKRSTFDQRVYCYKWSIEKALMTPVRKRG